MSNCPSEYARLEVEFKLGRLREFMREQELDALLLGRADNFAWITAGGDSRCASTTDMGVASVLITPNRQCILTSSIESDRVRAETLAHIAPADVFEFVEYPWHQGQTEMLDEIPGKLGADFDCPAARGRLHNLASLRMPFTPWEADRYPAIGREVSDAIERVCFRIEPGMTERTIAGMIAAELIQDGFTPTVVLVGADDRVRLRRHPTPTGKTLERYCMIVVCAHRGGLVVAVTRSVHFGRPPREVSSAHEAAARVHAAMIMATRVGAGYQDVIDRACVQYEAEGYGGEWQYHHQGGPIGYQDREFLVVPGAKQGTIANLQAIAWNPSVPGAKSEDTMLVSEDGLQIVTGASGEWPMIDVEVDRAVVRRPDILVR